MLGVNWSQGYRPSMNPAFASTHVIWSPAQSRLVSGIVSQGSREKYDLEAAGRFKDQQAPLNHISEAELDLLVYNERDWKFSATQKFVCSDGSVVGTLLELLDREGEKMAMKGLEVRGTYVPWLGKRFTLFGNLPTEIRRKIWRTALPGPRLLVLKYACFLDGRDDRPDQLPEVHSTVSEMATRSMQEADCTSFLTVCHESREVFLFNYHQIVVKKAPHPFVETIHFYNHVKPIFGQLPSNYSYIDCKRDTLIVPLYFIYNLIPISGMPDLSKVQNLALSTAYTQFPTVLLDAALCLFFPELKKIHLLFTEERQVQAKLRGDDFFYYLLDINDDFSACDIHDVEEFVSPRKRRQEKQRYVRWAQSAKERLHSLKLPGLKNVQIEASVATLINSPKYDPSVSHRFQPLVPTEPRFYGTTFFTEIPLEVPIPRGRLLHWMVLPEINGVSYCLINGKILNIPDSHSFGLEWLFMEGE